MKLARFLSLAGVTSRRKAEDLIRQGLVQVNEEVVDRPEERVSPQDRIYVEGRQIFLPQNFLYVLLHKPGGVLTTVNDPYGRETVMGLLQAINTRLYPVGRLDRDATGALLLTNDGELAHRLQHPSYEVPKIYQVRVKGLPGKEELRRLREGIQLEEGLTSPAKFELLRTEQKKREAHLKVELHQGWKRQIKRMFQAVGCQVLHLHRSHFAFLHLRGLPPGSYRYLSSQEVRDLGKMVKVTREGHN